MLTLVLTRHGHTDRSEPDQYLGQTIDIPLSVRGRSDAERLRDRLTGIPFDRVISSPLRRAVETATIIAPGLADIDRGVPGIFETTAKGRKGVAVAEARNGLCTICHVRLRPRVFNEVRKNESIIQCDSCRRILYFAGNSEASVPVPQA